MLSGGMDSATTLAVAKSQGYKVYALTIYYGQRHRLELESSRRIADYFKVSGHKMIDLDLRAFGGSALTDEIPVPKNHSNPMHPEVIPVTYVPARNTIFLAMALAWAEILGASDIFIGVNALDYSGYPDCRPEFIQAFERTANLGPKRGLKEGNLKSTPL